MRSEKLKNGLRLAGKLAESYPEGPPVVDLGALDRAGELRGDWFPGGR